MPSAPFLLCLQPRILHTRWVPQASVTSHPACPQMSSPPGLLPAPRSLQVLRGSPAFCRPQPCLPPTSSHLPSSTSTCHLLGICRRSVPSSPCLRLSSGLVESLSVTAPHRPHQLPEVLPKCSSDLRILCLMPGHDWETPSPRLVSLLVSGYPPPAHFRQSKSLAVWWTWQSGVCALQFPQLGPSPPPRAPPTTRFAPWHCCGLEPLGLR